MFSKFFINRPIFASVLSIIVTLAGGIALWTLPVAQYPEITPPTVEVSASFPGANAQEVFNSVAAPIEQQVNGVEGMLYMSSQCTNDGNYALTITFKNGIDLNMAQVLVQNRVALAQPVLPPLVQRRGVSVKKKSPNILMIVNLFSPRGTRDNLYLSNYATIQLKDELARLPGVGDVTYLGQRDYSMRIWLDPQKLARRNLAASDVVRAIEQQNTQVAAGSLGQPPVPSGQAFQFTMRTMGRLVDVEQFSSMILKSEESRVIRLGEVADIELGAQSYDQTCTLDGKASVALSIYQLPGSNALQTAKTVREKMEELKSRFPEDIDYAIVYDTTPFIQESVNEVFKTLRDAVILVAFVVLLFLQNWRSALIPLLAVPVAIVGTFAVMAAFDFSLNNLTLFGLVLAIGIVVDDAIVVVEAVEHNIEHGMSPRDATVRAMEQVSGPVIAVGLVLSAVFIPCAFITGISGQFFRQFALTIAVSTLISAFNSLTLSPALCALLLKPRQKGVQEALPSLAFVGLGGWIGWQFLPTLLAPLTMHLEWLRGLEQPVALAAGMLAGYALSRPLNFFIGWSFQKFNQGFEAATAGYAWIVGWALRLSLIVLVVYGLMMFATWHSFQITPRGFIPNQDKGYLLVNVQLPDSASSERSRELMKRIERLAGQMPGVKHTVAIAGQSLLLNANAPNFGSMYVMLDDFHKRKGAYLSADAIARRLQQQLQAEVDEGLVNVFGAPPVEGLGTAGGLKLILEDRTGDMPLAALQNVADRVVDQARETPGIQDAFTSFRANTPWLFLDVDREKARKLNVSIGELFATLQINLGSLYVNDFNRFGRTWQVIVQAEPAYRNQIERLRALEIRNEQGGMVKLASIADVKEVTGPVLLLRYNMYQSASINGTLSPGVSSGQGIDKLERAAREELAPSMRTEWTELAFLELQTGNTAMYVFALAVVLVFLVLAAQYESWSLPLAVILVVPVCLLCALAGVNLAGMDVNIFTQVGFIVLVGLACKNAILIVEYAKVQRENGQPRREATLEACKLRLRPIIMTSLAFILGVVPLMLSTGAGAEMRRTLGTAVFAGMLGVTLFGIFLTPVFFFVIQWFIDRRQQRLAAANGLTLTAPSANGQAGGDVGHG